MNADSAGARPLRVAIVDDHRHVAELFALYFEQWRGRRRFELGGTASRLSEVPLLLHAGHVDLLLVDYELPDGTGVEALRRLRRIWPRAKAALFTRYPEDELITEAALAGFDGFLSKDLGMRELVGALTRIAEGEVFFSPGVIESLAHRMSSAAARGEPAPAALTERERAALQALLDHGDTAVAARQLKIAAVTFRNHLHSAMSKLGVENRLQALSLALRLDLIRPPRERRR